MCISYTLLKYFLFTIYDLFSINSIFIFTSIIIIFFSNKINEAAETINLSTKEDSSEISAINLHLSQNYLN